MAYVAFSDTAPLTGTSYGVRAGSSGVEFTNLSCNSTTEVTETYATDIEVVSGKFTGKNGNVKSRVNDNVALIKGASMEEGTLTATIQTVSNSKAGLVFGYSNDENGEIYYRLVACKSTQSINVEKVVNGTFTTLFTNYASAGFNANKEFKYRVVINNGEAYCYFWKTLYYVVDLQSAGTGVGLYAENAGAVFSNYAVSSNAEYDTCDTLLFGHSYFELWNNYAKDLESINSYDLGECLNIGIGGSQASHWKKFKETLVKYDAKLGIYMIGINDLTAGVSPSTVVNNIKETLLYIKSVNADFKAVVISVNHCPARTNIASKISETNNLMEALCNQYDWMSYAEIEYAYCDDGVNPSAAWFTDGLHLTASGYRVKLIPAIEQALIKIKEN
jgi:lysophospholipase L1-like esterase